MYDEHKENEHKSEIKMITFVRLDNDWGNEDWKVVY